MSCDLHEAFGRIRTALPRDPKSQISFSSSSFSPLQNLLRTDQLVATTLPRVYGVSYRVDLVKFSASREFFQDLGMLILSVVFSQSGGRKVRVALEHPESTVKSLIIEYPGSTVRTSGHKTKPKEFVFSPSLISKHPWQWSGQFWELASFPSFVLTNSKEFAVTEGDWASRDIIKGFGNDDASVRLAELLLNIGYSEEKEIALEGEGGVRGVGINSAEATFVIKGPEG